MLTASIVPLLNKMHFDPSINLGTIISTLVLVGGVFHIVGKISSMETKVEAMWKNFLDIREK